MALVIRQSKRGRVTVLHLNGELLLGPPVIEFAKRAQAAVEEKPGALVLGLEQLIRFDSAALGELVTLQSRAAKAGIAVTLAGANDRVKQMLQVTHLDAVFTQFPSTDAAIEHYSQL